MSTTESKISYLSSVDKFKTESRSAISLNECLMGKMKQLKSIVGFCRLLIIGISYTEHEIVSSTTYQISQSCLGDFRMITVSQIHGVHEITNVNLWTD